MEHGITTNNGVAGYQGNPAKLNAELPEFLLLRKKETQ
jgi:hypothetical protein